MMRLAGCLALVCCCALTAAPQESKSIDSILEAEWKARGIERAPLASDAEFLRRVTLDITGTIPSEEEARAWSAPLSARNRAKKIDELLASPRYVEFMAELWGAVLYGYREGLFDTQRDPLILWLRKALAENMPYDRMVTALLTATGGNGENAPVNWMGRYYPQTGRPEEIAVKVSRTFLGFRLNCARCHDHPFIKRWTQDDFYGLAAFFKATERRYITNGRIAIEDVPDRAKAPYTPPDLKHPVKTKFLSGAEPQTANLRTELALYLTTNRQFARAFANRLWYQFFGRGIVHPVDNFGPQPPSVPKLMEFLADETIRLKFDTKAMIRLIAASRAYQLSSARSADDPDREAVFALARVRPLTPEQTTSAIMAALPVEAALGKTEGARVRRMFAQYLVRNALDEDLTNVFEYRESIQDVMTKMSIDLSRVAGKGWFADQPSIERIYLTTLSRRPSARERGVCEEFLKKGGGVEDLAVTLINSHEFAFNH